MKNEKNILIIFFCKVFNYSFIFKNIFFVLYYEIIFNEKLRFLILKNCKIILIDKLLS